MENAVESAVENAVEDAVEDTVEGAVEQATASTIKRKLVMLIGGSYLGFWI